MAPTPIPSHPWTKYAVRANPSLRLSGSNIFQNLKIGKYGWVLGPMYETKAEINNMKKAHSTELEVLEVNYDQGLKDNIFTESYLKRQ